MPRTNFSRVEIGNRVKSTVLLGNAPRFGFERPVCWRSPVLHFNMNV